MTTRIEFDKLEVFKLNAALAQFPKHIDRAKKSAFSSVGWFLKGELKKGFVNGPPGWPMATKRQMTPYIVKNPPRTDEGRKTKKEAWFRLGAQATAKKLWGILANLVVYSADKEGLFIGFQAGVFGKRTVRTASGKKKIRNVIGGTVVELAKLLTEGGEFEITEKRRRYFWAIGLPFKPGAVLVIPPRPVIGPVVVANHQKIWELFANKVWERIAKYQEKASEQTT